MGGESSDVTQRMSSVKTGVCTPTHVNTEVWTSSSMSTLKIYSNESYLVGGVGYYGLSGIYTTHKLVEDGAAANPQYYPGFWMHYRSSDALINALSVTAFKNNAAYYPPAKTYCADNTLGCRNNCSKSEACEQRESAGGLAWCWP